MPKPRTLPLHLYNRFIFTLALLGTAIAIYVLQSFLRDAPIVCVNTGCELVRKHSASYIMGIPIPTFGLVGYSLIALLSFLRSTNTPLRKTLLPYILAIATGGLGFVTWFTYTQLFIIRATCTWCAISTVTMITIFLLALQEFRNQTS